MKTNLIVVDDFYNNPDQVREAALNSSFEVAGNYPGLRTKPLTNNETKSVIEKTLGQKVTNWHDNLSGSFQLCTAHERSWIHSDYMNDYAAIVFLTPDAPLGSGTSIYRHKDTGTFGSIGQGENIRDLKGNRMAEIPNHHFSEKYQCLENTLGQFLLLSIFMAGNPVLSEFFKIQVVNA